MESFTIADTPAMHQLAWSQPWTAAQWQRYFSNLSSSESRWHDLFGDVLGNASNGTCPLWLWNGGPLVGYRILRCAAYPFARRTAIVLSSRIGRRLPHAPRWRRAARAVVGQLERSAAITLTASGTTCDPLLTAVAQRNPINLVRVELGSGDAAKSLPLQQSLLEWLRQTMTTGDDTRRECPRASENSAGTAAAATRFRTILVSPRLDHLSSQFINTSISTALDSSTRPARAVDRTEWTPGDQLPLADRVLSGLADDIYVLKVRAGGGIARLISDGFRLGAFHGKRLFLLDDPPCIATDLMDAWTRHGAIRWSVDRQYNSRAAAPKEGTSTNLLAPPVAVATATASGGGAPWVRAVNNVDTARFLSHWTRAPRGPWPEQSLADYYADWIFDSERRPTTALDTVHRILTVKRLLASARFIRSGTPAVCFTERALPEFPKLRRFRRHQAQWDFELYGVALDRDWLQRHGARPVIYGDDTTWQKLGIEQRAFYQPHRGRGRDAAWHLESEWRVIGDVDFSNASPRDGLVFVATQREALQLAPESWLPVVWFEI